MKKLVIGIALIFILLLTSVSAFEIDTYSAEYDLEENLASVSIDITLKESSSFEYILPEDAANIQVSETNEILDLRSYKLIKVSGPVKNINIKYTTSSVIERTKDNFFILDLAEIGTDDVSLGLKLPEGAVLKYSLDSIKQSVIPKTEDIQTNGQRIIINWDKNSLSTDAVLVIYKTNDFAIPWMELLFAVIIGVLITIVFKKRIKPITSEKKGDITRNLFEEEKKIVEILLKDGEMWQKQLEMKSGIGKVKLSRKLRALEQKKVIEKIPYGNTNKIRVKP